MSFWLVSSKIDQKKYLANQILLLKKILIIRESIHKNKNIETEGTLGMRKMRTYKKVISNILKFKFC